MQILVHEYSGTVVNGQKKTDLVTVNVDHIVRTSIYEDVTTLHLTNGKLMMVTETPAQLKDKEVAEAFNRR